MRGTLRRRQFLQSASALGLAGLGSMDALARVTPARAADMAVGPDAVRFRPEIEPVVRWIEETPARPGLRGRPGRAEGGALVPRPARGPVPRRHPQHQAEAGRVQVPRGDGHQLGPPARPGVGDGRAAAAPALGPRQLQELAGPGHQGRGLDPRARSTRPGSPSPTRRARRSSRRWTPGTRTRPTRRSPGSGPVRRRGRDDGGVLAVRRPRPAQHRPQGDLRHAVLADPPGDRLAARRARPPLARLRPARPPGRQAARRRRPVRGQPRERQEGPRRLAARQARRRRDPLAARRRSARPTPEAASAEAVKLLNDGVAPDSLWDAVVLAGNELLTKNPGIVALHAVTVGERPALHLRRQRRRHQPAARPASRPSAGFPRSATGSRSSRAAGHRRARAGVGRRRRGTRRSPRSSTPSATTGAWRRGKALGYLRAGGSTDLIFAAARRMIFHKGRDSHDYKYGAAAWEECVLGDRPEVAGPARRRHDVLRPRHQDPRQPPHEAGPGGGGAGARLIQGHAVARVVGVSLRVRRRDMGDGWCRDMGGASGWGKLGPERG